MRPGKWKIHEFCWLAHNFL